MQKSPQMCPQSKFWMKLLPRSTVLVVTILQQPGNGTRASSSAAIPHLCQEALGKGLVLSLLHKTVASQEIKVKPCYWLSVQCGRVLAPWSYLPSPGNTGYRLAVTQRPISKIGMLFFTTVFFLFCLLWYTYCYYGTYLVDLDWEDHSQIWCKIPRIFSGEGSVWT